MAYGLSERHPRIHLRAKLDEQSRRGNNAQSVINLTGATMAPFYFNDFKGQRHYAKTREEAEKLRAEVMSLFKQLTMARKALHQALSI